jgi:cytochrome P450
MSVEASAAPVDEIARALASEDYITNPYPIYARLRDNPGWLAPSGYRVFSSYEHVQGILKQPDIFGQERVPYPNFHTYDQPEHTRLRRLVSKTFTAHSVGQLRDGVDATVARLLDDVEGKTEFDLVQEFAVRLSASVITDIFQVSEEIGLRWHGWLMELARFRGRTHYFPTEGGDDPGALEAAKRANQEASEFMKNLIAERSEVRDTGIVSGLLAASEADDSLTEEEILYTLVLLVGAGLHTTAGQIGNTFRALLRHPAELEKVRQDPEKIPNAVEEALRFEGALQAEYRVVRQPTQLAGYDLAVEDHVIIINAAANHDPTVFSDPDHLDVDRDNARRHLTFGFGIHQCLGAELARTEIRSAMRQVLERYPHIELLGDGNQTRWDRWRSVSALPIRVSR